jgi:hypothetical protein
MPNSLPCLLMRSTIDNGSWICVHAYVVDCWTKIPIVVCVNSIINGLGSNNLTEVIMNALLKGGGLMKEKLATKFFCFGKDGLNVFQGGKHESQNISRIPRHHFLWVFTMFTIGQTWWSNSWGIRFLQQLVFHALEIVYSQYY